MQQIDSLHCQQRALQEENEWLRRDREQLLQAKQGGPEGETSGRLEGERNVGEEFLGRILQKSQLRDRNQLLMFQVREEGREWEEMGGNRNGKGMGNEGNEKGREFSNRRSDMITLHC